MSARALLQAAVKRALEEHAPLANDVTGVFDAPPSRAARPYALVEEPVLADWGTKDLAGREGRISVLVHDAGEPARLRMLIEAAEAAVGAMPPNLGEGWRVTSLSLVRSRIVREGEGRRVAASEWRVRVLRDA